MFKPGQEVDNLMFCFAIAWVNIPTVITVYGKVMLIYESSTRIESFTQIEGDVSNLHGKYHDQRPLLLKWFNFNLKMDEW